MSAPHIYLMCLVPNGRLQAELIIDYIATHNARFSSTSSDFVPGFQYIEPVLLSPHDIAGEFLLAQTARW